MQLLRRNAAGNARKECYLPGYTASWQRLPHVVTSKRAGRQDAGRARPESAARRSCGRASWRPRPGRPHSCWTGTQRPPERSPSTCPGTATQSWCMGGHVSALGNDRRHVCCFAITTADSGRCIAVFRAHAVIPDLPSSIDNGHALRNGRPCHSSRPCGMPYVCGFIVSGFRVWHARIQVARMRQQLQRIRRVGLLKDD